MKCIRDTVHACIWAIRPLYVEVINKEETVNSEEDLMKIKKSMDGFLLPNYIKPCVALMMDESFGEGEQSDVAYIIATELRRIGKTEEASESILNKWNRKNDTPLGESKIKSTIRSAYKSDITFGCKKNYIILDYCARIGKEFCEYNKELTQRQQKKANDRDYYRLGWQKVLTNAEKIIYFAIMEIEKIRKFPQGSKLFVSFRMLVHISGITQGYIRKCLEGLSKKGILKCKIGQSFRWKTDATEIKRIIPIPKPSTNKIRTGKVKIIEHIEEQQGGIYIPEPSGVLSMGLTDRAQC